MATITLDSVIKRYGDTQVIHGVSLEVSDGELIVIVGPSGCGKSTLLRMVAGLEVISEGEISIGERVVNRLEPKDRDIAMVFQNYALYPHMSVRGNMAYGLKILGKSKEEIERRVQEAARMLELSELLDRRPRQLSGGQRQRVAMGRAIVRSPSAFLFDEPLSNLDAKLRVQMRLEIKQLQRKLGTTSLYVTHDQVEAMTLADRLVVMNAGVAEQIASPLEIYNHPASTFVASFIGSPAMNFVQAKVGSDGASLTLSDGAPLRGKGVQLGNHAGREVTLGIRPEHLAIAEHAQADLTLRVQLVETLGADTLAHGVLVGSQAQVSGEAARVMTVRLPALARVAEGEELPLRTAEGALHLFDAESGKTLAEI